MKKRLSASRLNDFLGCAHHAALWLDGVQEPEDENASLELIRQKGFEHEATVLKQLEAGHGPAASISTSGTLEKRVADTLVAISDGASLIYQGAFASDRWVGFPDFLIRTGRANDIWCQSAFKRDPGSASKRDPPEGRVLTSAHPPSELFGRLTIRAAAGSVGM